jgi:hypothetical protein
MVGGMMLALASCVGSVSTEQFQDEVHERGGGLGRQVIVDAVEAVGDDQGTDLVQVRSLSVLPGRVAMEVQVPGSLEDVDAYTYGTSGVFGAGGLDGPEPVHTSSTDQPLESAVFTTEEAGLERFDELVDDAIAQADLPGGYATGAEIARPSGTSAGPATRVTVTNERRTVTVTFAADGTLLEVAR